MPTTDEQLAYALERAVAAVAQRFQRAPDALLSHADLIAALYSAASGEPLLSQVLQARDRRRTTPLRLRQPTFQPSTHGVPACYDVAVLRPNWLQGHPLEAAANLGGAGARLFEGTRFDGERRPFVAVLTARLVESLSDPAVISDLLGDLNGLACADREASYRYMVILCRHWDLDAHIRKTLHVFSQWAELHPQVSLVLLQAYYDDIGPVYGGRYLNLWEHMAPLDPLERLYPMAHRRGD